MGKDITKNLNKYLNAPNIEYQIINSEYKYEKETDVFKIGSVELDKIYEAKCLPYLQPNDLLWVVGRRL